MSMNADMENVIENLEDLVNTLKLTNDMFDKDECESLLDKVQELEMDVTATLVALKPE
jgi:hypothetical protein